MAVDLKALVSLQNRRTQRAVEMLALANAALQAAEWARQEQARQCKDSDASHASRRSERIRAILREPPSQITLSRVRLQYEVGEDEMARLSAELRARQEEVQAALLRVNEAKHAVDTCMKRLKKLEEAAARAARGLVQLDDMKAELETER